MKKLLLLFMLLAMVSIDGSAQEITVKSIEYLQNDMEARRNEVLDNNGTPCAYIRISVPRAEGMKFTGIKGEAKYRAGEYGVYVPEGTKRIKFNHEKYQAGTIDFTGFVEKIEKQCVYLVVLDVPLIGDSYEDLLEIAKEHYKNHPSHTESDYYDAARIAYDNAINHKDCPQNMRDVLREERDTMASIRKYTYFAEETERRADKAEKEQGFESDEVYKNLGGTYKFLNRLITSHPEIEGLKVKRDRVWERLSKHSKAKEMVKETVTIQRQVIEGKVKKSNNYDFRPLNSLHVNVSHQRDVSKKDARQAAKQIGNVAADGSFRIVVPDGYDYLFIDGEKQAHLITSDMTTIDIIL